MYFRRDALKIGDIHQFTQVRVAVDTGGVWSRYARAFGCHNFFWNLCLRVNKADGKRYRLGIDICGGDFRGAGNL